MADNTQQAEFWNGRMGDAWSQAEAQIDQILAPLSDAAIKRLAPEAGEQIMDVGCGGGGTSVALSQSDARVHGVDISEKMISCAQPKSSRFDSLTFSVGDAETAVFQPEYDAVFSRFGVMFFADPVAAFTNIRSALKPTGRMTFLCWQTPGANPWISVAAAALQPFRADAPAPDPREPGPFAFADKGYLHEILEAAGFQQIDIEPLTRSLHLGDTVAQAMQFQSQIGPLSGLLEELDEQRGREATQAVADALSSHATETGIDLGAATWLVSARHGG